MSEINAAPRRRSAVRKVAAGLRDAARRVLDRALHGSRRSRSLRVIQQVQSPRVILFICYGNICRSSYAAYAASERLAKSSSNTIKIVSAGYYGPGRPAPDTAIDAARGLGVDLRPHRSQLLTPDLIAGADLVIGMERKHGDRLVEQFGAATTRFVLLGTLDPDVSVPPEIPDPYGKSLEFFDHTYRRIDRCLATLLHALDSHGSSIRS